jgi:hypothetical protein
MLVQAVVTMRGFFDPTDYDGTLEQQYHQQQHELQLQQQQQQPQREPELVTIQRRLYPHVCPHHLTDLAARGLNYEQWRMRKLQG